jgi:hypothetical protein
MNHDAAQPKDKTFGPGDWIYLMDVPYSLLDSAGTDSTGMWPDKQVPNTPPGTNDWPDNFAFAMRVNSIVDSMGNANWVIPNVDKILIDSYNYITPRDTFLIEVHPQTVESKDVDLSKTVKVVPNPYIVGADFERHDGNVGVLFTNLPPQCKIHIFNISGEHIISLYHDKPTVGFKKWNLLTKEGTEAAYGLYVYKIESDWGNPVGKFAIIR